MIQKLVGFVTLAATSLVLVVPAANGQSIKGVKNSDGQEWLVRYHLNDPNKWGDIALRLFVEKGDGNSKSLKGTLWRYDDKTDDKKYQLRTDGGGFVDNLAGSILKNQEESGKRKRETFEIAGSFEHTDRTMYDVTVKGFHHTGRKKANAHREDDQLIIRINITPQNSAAAKPKRLETEDCDEQPPDEDVLTEGDPSDPPAYDPDDP